MQYSPSLDFDSRIIRWFKKTRSFFHSFRRENITIELIKNAQQDWWPTIHNNKKDPPNLYNSFIMHLCMYNPFQNKTEEEAQEQKFCPINNLSYVSICLMISQKTTNTDAKFLHLHWTMTIDREESILCLLMQVWTEKLNFWSSDEQN